MLYILRAVVLLGTQIWKNKGEKERVKKKSLTKVSSIYIKYT